MQKDDPIGRYIRRLSRLLRNIVLQSKEFEELCLLLEKGELEMRLFLVPILFQPKKKGIPRKKRESPLLRFELTAQDKQFLKRVGIRF